MLTINEIFYSIQGESTYAGRPCVFVRLTACDLRCSWCDSPKAFHEGGKRSLDDVFRAEYIAALACTAHGDFAEGIRALLIDKDKNPRWNPPTLDEVTSERVAAFFAGV